MNRVAVPPKTVECGFAAFTTGLNIIFSNKIFSVMYKQQNISFSMYICERQSEFLKYKQLTTSIEVLPLYERTSNIKYCSTHQ